MPASPPPPPPHPPTHPPLGHHQRRQVVARRLGDVRLAAGRAVDHQPPAPHLHAVAWQAFSRAAGQRASVSSVQVGLGVCENVCVCSVIHTLDIPPPAPPHPPRRTRHRHDALDEDVVVQPGGLAPRGRRGGPEDDDVVGAWGPAGSGPRGWGRGGACGIESEGVGGGGGGGGGGAARQPSKQPPHPPSELGPLSSNRHTQPPRPAPPHRTAPYRTPTAPHLAKRYVSFSATSRSPTSKVGNMESEGIKRGSAMARRIA